MRTMKVAAFALLYSTASLAGDCGTAQCGTDSDSLSGSQSQEQYNSIAQSPTMALNSSQSNTVVNANSFASDSLTISADGGFSQSGQCATNTFTMSAGGGVNNSQSKPMDYRTESDNMFISGSIVIPFGSAQDNCLERQAVGVRATEMAFARYKITTCISLMNAKMDLAVLAKVDPKNFGHCPEVMAQAQQGLHGEIARKAVAQYKASIQPILDEALRK
ncbi:hypothetical protein [Vibrio phage VCPH]|nr:hypothetical protein [Vibrio phage VCPH]